MKKGLNRTEMIGNVGAEDAKSGITGSGTPVVNFSLAVNDSYKDRAGTVKESTTWVKVSIYGRRAEALAPYIKSGIPLFLGGRVSVGKAWESQKDGWKSDLVLTVGNGDDDFRFLGGGIREAEAAAAVVDTGDEQLYAEEQTGEQ